ncbi:MAG TPA: hypothetical protein VHI72_19980 [Hyphomicrobiaceae bacterium]|jgi:hypothetical protein|nr:hypothetical protein [Hyphomicrobiaceae bacterium]
MITRSTPGASWRRHRDVHTSRKITCLSPLPKHPEDETYRGRGTQHGQRFLPERLARRPDLTGRFLRIFGVPERLLDDLIFTVAFSKQGAQNAGRVDRLREAHHVPIFPGDRLLLVSRHEDERYAARAKSVGYGIDHVAAQVDIENRCVEAPAMLYELQRLLNTGCWPYRFHAQLAKLVCNARGEQKLILNQEHAVNGGHHAFS